MKLMVICPVLPNYRLDFYGGLRRKLGKLVLFADGKAKRGFDLNFQGEFEFHHVPTFSFFGKIYYQWGVLRGLLKEKPDALFMTLDFRALNFWLLLGVTFLLQIPTYLHTHGIYRKESRRTYWLYRLLFRVVAAFSTRLICYTKSVRDGLVRARVSSDKLTVMDNFLVNKNSISPKQKTYDRLKLLYIGRLREGSELPLLLEAMQLLLKKGLSFDLDIVGDGVQLHFLESKAKEAGLNVIFHGSIYDSEQISKISQPCTFGIYPGDAGLSIVHYMSLSLVTVVHSSLELHMGPEPSYVVDGETGITFQRENAQDLADCIEKLFLDTKQARLIATNGYELFQQMKTPTMEDKFVAALKGPT